MTSPLYKFVKSKEAVLAMAEGKLKFTPPAELNDPTELVSTVRADAVAASLRELRERGYTEAQFEWLGRQAALLDLVPGALTHRYMPRTREKANRMLRSSGYNDIQMMTSSQNKVVAQIRSAMAILSLSESYQSLPMWAHYADMANGFVVVLENLGLDFAGDNTGSLNILKRVDYPQEFVGMTFDPSTQDRLFFSKLSDWQYEREWRVVTTLESCESSGGIRIRRVDPRRMTGVIVGWGVSEQDASSLQEELIKVNPHARVSRASLGLGGRVARSE